MCGKMFQFMVLTLEKALNLRIFTHVPVSHSKLQVQFFENLFSPRAKNKGVEETMILFIKIHSENTKMTCLYEILNDIAFHATCHILLMRLLAYFLRKK